MNLIIIINNKEIMIQFLTGNGIKPSIYKKLTIGMFAFGGFGLGYYVSRVNW